MSFWFFTDRARVSLILPFVSHSFLVSSKTSTFSKLLICLSFLFLSVNFRSNAMKTAAESLPQPSTWHCLPYMPSSRKYSFTIRNSKIISTSLIRMMHPAQTHRRCSLFWLSMNHLPPGYFRRLYAGICRDIYLPDLWKSKSYTSHTGCRIYRPWSVLADPYTVSANPCISDRSYLLLYAGFPMPTDPNASHQLLNLITRVFRRPPQ